MMAAPVNFIAIAAPAFFKSIAATHSLGHHQKGSPA
jgi:ABC-type enterobactin transport system permease subunit